MTETEFKVLKAAIEQAPFSLPRVNTRETLATLAVLVTRGWMRASRVEGGWVWDVTPAGRRAYQESLP